MRRVHLTILVIPLLAACTAMGAWVYDDPSFALRSVTLRRAAAPGNGAADSLELLFMGCNRNDYDLLSDGFRTQLAVAGRMVAQGTREQPIFLGTRDTSSFVVVLPFEAQQFDSSSRNRPFELNGMSVIHTPIGDRDVIFRLRGRVESGEQGVRWLGEGGPRCRPGLSALPGIFDRRAPLGPEDTTRVRPRPGYPEDPNQPGQPQQPGQSGPGGRPQR